MYHVWILPTKGYSGPKTLAPKARRNGTTATTVASARTQPREERASPAAIEMAHRPLLQDSAATSAAAVVTVQSADLPRSTNSSSGTTSTYHEDEQALAKTLPAVASIKTRPASTKKPRVTIKNEEITRRPSLEQYSISNLRGIFEHIDKDHSGSINVREMILGLRRDAELADALHLPQHIWQEDGTREAFETVFQAMHRDDLREVTWNDFFTYVVSHQDVHREDADSSADAAAFSTSAAAAAASAAASSTSASAADTTATSKRPSAAELRDFMAKELATNGTESSTQTPALGPRPAAGNVNANVPTTVSGALSIMSAETEDLDITLEALAARHEVRTLTLNDEETRIESQEKEIMEQLALLDNAQSRLKIKRTKLQDAKARQRTELAR